MLVAFVVGAPPAAGLLGGAGRARRWLVRLAAGAPADALAGIGVYDETVADDVLVRPRAA